MNTGQIIKSKQTERYTVIPNAILEDGRLSLRAIGLLCYILRLPADWGLNKTRLHEKLKEGRDAVLVAFRELENAGYIQSEEVRNGGKFAGFNYIVYDKPQETKPKEVKPNTEIQDAAPLTEKPLTEKPNTDNPTPEKPITENPQLQSKDSTKYELNKELTPESKPNGNLFDWPEIPKPDGKKKKGNTAPREISMPYESFEFSQAWANWKEYKAGEFLFKYRSLQSEQAALMALANMASDGGEQLAIKILNHTMANGWKGFVIPKPQTNGHETTLNGYHRKSTGNAPDITAKEAATSIAQRFGGKGI